ncbi:microtubule-associated protein 1a [Gigaspora margarita]|uniref:Microtubule-associated protein 1a n=1 Tax=Gigaspora margarita TaxID=4874 RepID=A0A8H4APM7_GIGMA|nr:microtubule-associated protein 1a [Gigaspora margarita]
MDPDASISSTILPARKKILIQLPVREAHFINSSSISNDEHFAEISSWIDAKNFRISDNDPNNISQLTSDIEDLKARLYIFCSLKKVNINYTAFKDLLKKYGCSSAGEKPSKNLLRGILQRHVIDMIIENANKYLKIDDENEQFLETNENEKEQPLEAILISTTQKLLKYIDLFSTNRIGNDEVTKSAPMKLRQLVNSVLENRGFSEILNEG